MHKLATGVMHVQSYRISQYIICKVWTALLLLNAELLNDNTFPTHSPFGCGKVLLILYYLGQCSKINQKGAAVQLLGCKLPLKVTEEDAASVPTTSQMTLCQLFQVPFLCPDVVTYFSVTMNQPLRCHLTMKIARDQRAWHLLPGYRLSWNMWVNWRLWPSMIHALMFIFKKTEKFQITSGKVARFVASHF